MDVLAAIGEGEGKGTRGCGFTNTAFAAHENETCRKPREQRLDHLFPVEVQIDGGVAGLGDLGRLFL